jgi:hypothetical protein
MTTARENTATFLAADVRARNIFDLFVETIYEATVRRILRGIQRTG